MLRWWTWDLKEIHHIMEHIPGTHGEDVEVAEEHHHPGTWGTEETAQPVVERDEGSRLLQ